MLIQALGPADDQQATGGPLAAGCFAWPRLRHYGFSSPSRSSGGAGCVPLFVRLVSTPLDRSDMARLVYVWLLARNVPGRSASPPGPGAGPSEQAMLVAPVAAASAARS